MGKPKKRTKSFQYNKNRKKAWKKHKQLPSIGCNQLKDAWDTKKGIKENMQSMGLSMDINKTMGIPRARDMIGKPKAEKMEVDTVKPKPAKAFVAEALEAEASIPRPRAVRLSHPDAQLCMYMMETHGEDYKKMARDDRNYYQATPKQIRKKILTFKSIPEQYKAYLEAKKEGTLNLG